MRNTAVAVIGVAVVVGSLVLVGGAAHHAPTKPSPTKLPLPDGQAPPPTDRAVVSAQVASEGRTTTDAPLESVLSFLPSPDGVAASDVASAFVLSLTNFDAGEDPEAVASRA